MSKDLPGPYKMFGDIGHVQYYQTKLETFFQLEGLSFSSKDCVFNTFLGVTEMILYLPQYLPKYLFDSYKLSLEVCYTRQNEKKKAKIFSFLH